MRRIRTLFAVFIFCSSCGRDPNTVIVGSKNFTEQVILGEIAAQQLERKLHIKIERRLDLGGTLLAQSALVAGQIDLYPEYTGTASSAVLKEHTAKDPGAAYEQVKAAYRERFQLTWLPPLGFNDTFAMVVRAAEGNRLRSPDLSAAAESRTWRLGVGYEFLTRSDGLTNLNRSYSLRWEGTPKTMDLGLLYKALLQKQVDMAAGNSTDGVLTDPAFMVLQDDKRAFPPYSACFVVRESVLTERPDVRGALEMLSGHISDETMRSLNRSVDVEHRPVVRVAHDFLATQP